MATISFMIPDEAMPRVVDALCAVGRYDRLPDPKPARATYARTVVAGFIRGAVARHEGDAAGSSAARSVIAAAARDVTVE